MHRHQLYRVSAVLMAVCVLLAAATGGVCLCRGLAAAGEKSACVLSLDVCGGSGQSTAVPGMDAAITPDVVSPCCYLIASIIPPAPATAVASAYTGEDEKPPEA